MEDLLELIDVGRRGRSARPAPVAGDGVVAAPAEADVVAAAAEGAAPDEVEDLRELAQICRARPERRHERRSWQATQHARAANKQKNDARASQAEARAEAAEATCSVVARQFQVVAQSLGVKAQQGPMDLGRAWLQLRIAFAVVSRGFTSGLQRKTQVRACFVAARAIRDSQDEFVRRELQAPQELENLAADLAASTGILVIDMPSCQKSPKMSHR